MHLRSLEHLLQAVSALVHPEQIIVLGSSSLLGTDGKLGEPGQPVEFSLDADLLLFPTNDQLAGVLHEAVGEDSLFHRNYGCFADILKPEIRNTLPKGWEARLVKIPGIPQAYCLEPHDLALVKLSLGRPKDVALLRELLRLGTITMPELQKRYQATPWDEHRLVTIGRNLGRLAG